MCKGDSNTTLANAMERHMNIMWHIISQGCGMKTVFLLHQPWLMIYRESMIPVKIHHCAKKPRTCHFDDRRNLE